MISNSEQVKLWQTHYMMLRAAQSESIQTTWFHTVFARVFVQRAGCNNNYFLWTREQSANRDTIQVTKAELAVQGKYEWKACVSRRQGGRAGAEEGTGGSDWFAALQTSLFQDVLWTPQMFGWNEQAQFGLAWVQLGLWMVLFKALLNHMAPRTSATKPR